MPNASFLGDRTNGWMRRQFWPSVIFMGLFLLFGFWYYEGNNFSDRNIPGTYIADDSHRSNVLTLKSDHTYTQDALVNGTKQHAFGKWSLGGNVDAHILFNGTFMNAPSAAIGRDDHNAFGMFDNLFGYLTLTLQSDTTPLVFHKKYLLF